MKRGTKLLILGAVLVVACLAVWLVTELTAPEPLPHSTELGETVKTVDVSTIKNIKWTFGEESYDFNFDGTNWVCNLQKDYVPDAAKMAAVVHKISDIRAEKVIEKPEDLSIYGLDKPSCVVTAGELVLKFGDASSFNETRYMSMGDGKVYMVPNGFYNAFAYTRNKFVQMHAIPDMSALTAVTVENKNGVTTLQMLADNDYTYSQHYVWFLKDNTAPISQEVVAGVLQELQNLEWMECVEALAEDLALYGLDQPSVKCTATSADGSFTFLIGSKGNQGYFAAVEGSSQVYLLDTTASEIFGAVNPGMMACTDVLKLDFTTVTSVEVTMDGQTNVLTAGENGTWTLDGKEVEGATVLEAINLMVSEAEEGLDVQGLSTELKLVFNRNTEDFSKLELTFYRHDGTNCMVQLDDYAPMLVLRSDVVALKEAFNTLFLG